MAISYKKLWKLLIDKDIRKQELRTLTNPVLSTATLAKLTRGENVNTEVLLRICKALNCDIGDIMEITPED